MKYYLSYPPNGKNIIVTDNEGIKKLSYIKMGSITWEQFVN